MSTPTYRIKDWGEHFENSESKKVKSARWIPIPNKHDGKGYRRVAQHPEGVAIFCAWNLILQVASKVPVRGILADEDGPLDSSDLAAMTGFPAEIFDAAFKLLTEPKIGWLECDAEAAASGNFRMHPEVSGDAGRNPPRTEGNGTEQKGITHTPPTPSREAQTIESDNGRSENQRSVCVSPIGNSKFSKPELRRYGEAQTPVLGEGWVTTAWKTGNWDDRVEIFYQNGGQDGVSNAVSKPKRGFAAVLEKLQNECDPATPQPQAHGLAARGS